MRGILLLLLLLDTSTAEGCAAISGCCPAAIWRQALRAAMHTMLSAACALSLRPAAPAQLSTGAIETIASGRVHVERSWIPPDLVAALKEDAEYLHAEGMFSADGLTNNAIKKDQQGFSAAADRQTFRAGDWGFSRGNREARLDFARRMAELMQELASGLDRPT
eukprot:1940700-Prymnesium_polylepis.1